MSASGKVSDNLPPPLSPESCDLRGLNYMPLFGAQMFSSDFNAEATDAEFRAGLALYWAAWCQVPAGSLPSSDKALCGLAGLGRDVEAWRALRSVALHGFVECSDGRLYHPFLCRQAQVAWGARVAARDRKRQWRDKKAKPERSGGGDVPGTGQSQAKGRDGQVPSEVKQRDVASPTGKQCRVASQRSESSSSGTTGQPAQPTAPPSLGKPVLVSGKKATAEQPALNGSRVYAFRGCAVPQTPAERAAIRVERRALLASVKSALAAVPARRPALADVLTAAKLATWLQPNPGNTGSTLTADQVAGVRRLLDAWASAGRVADAKGRP